MWSNHAESLKIMNVLYFPVSHVGLANITNAHNINKNIWSDGNAALPIITVTAWLDCCSQQLKCAVHFPKEINQIRFLPKSI